MVSEGVISISYFRVISGVLEPWALPADSIKGAEQRRTWGPASCGPTAQGSWGLKLVLGWSDGSSGKALLAPVEDLGSQHLWVTQQGLELVPMNLMPSSGNVRHCIHEW